MAALCPAWAHTYQTMCSDLKPSGSPSQRNITMLPTCRITTRLTGTESPGWRLFTVGGLRRRIDGTEMVGWGVAIVSPENFSRVICVIPGYRRSLVPRPAATTPLNSLVLLRLFVGLIPSFSAVLVCALFLTPNTQPVSQLALPTLRGT